MRNKPIQIILAAALATSFACAGREHVREDHGEKSAEWYKQQRVYEVGAKERSEGLDSEEAAAIHGEYRSTIGSGQGASKPADPRVLILDESPKNARSKDYE